MSSTLSSDTRVTNDVLTNIFGYDSFQDDSNTRQIISIKTISTEIYVNERISDVFLNYWTVTYRTYKLQPLGYITGILLILIGIINIISFLAKDIFFIHPSISLFLLLVGGSMLATMHVAERTYNNEN